ncbi:Bug family tripartite tricarboxylate transporter substrate binding protein [Humitalea sp. 24SJ18S-53]|uniref:Bug family tripartite tricarboxylate transporter substrate binding protein n=1 Tax=Humitalea sp. 24SJ18S-53 TaxID=3422307 RepID=UPI003D67F668
MGKLLALATALLVAAAPHPGVAQDAYPSRAIRLVVSYPPGGSSDLIGRVLAQGLQDELRREVVVENRGGGGGVVGVEMVARAAPDGYLLLVTNAATFGTVPQVLPRLPYDPRSDFTPISIVAQTFSPLGVGIELPVRNVQELVALARREPGRLNFGTAGTGSLGHFLGEMLRVQAGIDIVHVPYRGSGLAMNDMIAGRVQIMIDPTVAAEASNGRVRLIGVANAMRMPGWPDVPTMQESGFPELMSSGAVGLVGPAGMPRDIVDRLNAAAAAMAAAPASADRLGRLGVMPRHSTPAELATAISADLDRFARVKRDAGLVFE